MKQAFKLLGGAGLLCVSLLLALPLAANTNYSKKGDLRIFTKTINKQYNVSSDVVMYVSNRHGNINFKTWDQNQVRVTAKIEVEASSETDAQEIFDRISFDFSNSSSRVSAVTNIAEKSRGWFDWSNDDDDFDINYTIYIPTSANLEVEAKYCNVFSEAINGQGQFEVKYGNVKLDGLGEDSNLELAYGNGTIVKTRDLKLDLAYGNLDVDEAGDIEVDIRYGTLKVENAGDIISDSRYSNFRLGEIREFRNDGKYDNVEIDFADEVVCETHYTNVDVARLGRRMNLDMAFGSAKARRVEASFDEINLNGSYTDFKVYMPANVNCNIDLSGTHADINLPNRGVTTNYDARSGSSHEVRGRMGNGNNGTITARLNYGGIRLQTL